jgi:excisionase family DNA binding protein
MSRQAKERIDRNTPWDALPEFLSPGEFRAYLSLGRSTVYDLLRRDEIPSVKFGKCIRIPKTALRQVPAAEVE